MLLEVGRVVKAHGLRGEVIVDLVTHRTERVDPGAVLTTEEGELVVAASRPHQRRFIVAFEGVGDRDGAEALRGLALAAPAIDDDTDDPGLWLHELVGADVVRRVDGVRCGRVVAVEANPASDLLVLDTGGLVPATFVTGWDDEGRLVIDPPDGLLDL